LIFDSPDINIIATIGIPSHASTKDAAKNAVVGFERKLIFSCSSPIFCR